MTGTDFGFENKRIDPIPWCRLYYGDDTSYLPIGYGYGYSGRSRGSIIFWLIYWYVKVRASVNHWWFTASQPFNPPVMDHLSPSWKYIGEVDGKRRFIDVSELEVLTGCNMFGFDWGVVGDVTAFAVGGAGYGGSLVPVAECDLKGIAVDNKGLEIIHE